MPIENKTLNDISLLGYVGDAPKIIDREDFLIAVVSLATVRGYGEHQKTDWHTVVFKNAWAETVSLLKKGDVILCKGGLQYKIWHDTEHNIDRKVAEIHSSECTILKGERGERVRFAYKKNESNSNESGGGYGNFSNKDKKKDEPTPSTGQNKNDESNEAKTQKVKQGEGDSSPPKDLPY